MQMAREILSSLDVDVGIGVDHVLGEPWEYGDLVIRTGPRTVRVYSTEDITLDWVDVGDLTEAADPMTELLDQLDELSEEEPEEMIEL